MRPAIFMDRDGTVSEEIGYMFDPSMYRPFPWTGPAVRRINDSPYRAILITNQSGVGRGFFTEQTVHDVHEVLRQELARSNAALDAIYYCPHHPEAGCECRKPKPGLLFRAHNDMDIDLARSFMIGDRYLDVLTAAAAGARSVLVLTGDGRMQYEERCRWKVHPDLVAENLEAAVDLILRSHVT